jgi:hypothetical protein
VTTYTFDDSGSLPIHDGKADVRIVDGQLVATLSEPGVAAGLPIGGKEFSNVVCSTCLQLTDGAQDDYYGIFLRRARKGKRAGHYIAFTVSATGIVGVFGFDGRSFLPIVESVLPTGRTFAAGLRVNNVFTAVLNGSAVSLLLNDELVISLALDDAEATGELGPFVRHGFLSPQARIATEYVMVEDL